MKAGQRVKLTKAIGRLPKDAVGTIIGDSNDEWHLVDFDMYQNLAGAWNVEEKNLEAIEGEAP